MTDLSIFTGMPILHKRPGHPPETAFDDVRTRWPEDHHFADADDMHAFGQALDDIYAGYGGVADTPVLTTFLEFAVPMWIAEHLERGGPKDVDIERLQLAFLQYQDGRYGDGGEAIFPGTKPGQTAALANRLAEAIAVMAFTDGGVHAFGMHWEARR